MNFIGVEKSKESRVTNCRTANAGLRFSAATVDIRPFVVSESNILHRELARKSSSCGFDA